MNTDKKKYTAPISSFVEVEIDIIALSKLDDENIDSEDQLSKEYGTGSWEDIWNAQ